MTGYQFDWVDAFTSQLFGGNGCAVVHGAGNLPPETCMQFVCETSLSECTFLEASDVADIKVRYFLAGREIPFAGHPTIATVASLLDRGLVTGDHLTLETGVGLLPIEINRAGDGPAQISMTQIAPDFGPDLPHDLVAAVGGLQAQDIAEVPQVTSTGLPFVITVVKDHDALRRAALDMDALARMAVHLGLEDAGVIKPFWVTLEGASDAGDTFSRLLLPPPNPPEDPFTGSATGAMAAYLWRHGLIESPHFVAEQGHWLGRPGQAQVEVLGPRDAITGVRVAGQGRILMSGEVRL